MPFDWEVYYAQQWAIQQQQQNAANQAAQQAAQQQAQQIAATLANSDEGFASWVVLRFVVQVDAIRFASWCLVKPAKPALVDEPFATFVATRSFRTMIARPRRVEPIVLTHTKPHPHESLVTRREKPL